MVAADFSQPSFLSNSNFLLLALLFFLSAATILLFNCANARSNSKKKSNKLKSLKMDAKVKSSKENGSIENSTESQKSIKKSEKTKEACQPTKNASPDTVAIVAQSKDEEENEKTNILAKQRENAQDWIKAAAARKDEGKVVREAVPAAQENPKERENAKSEEKVMKEEAVKKPRRKLSKQKPPPKQRRRPRYFEVNDEDDTLYEVGKEMPTVDFSQEFYQYRKAAAATENQEPEGNVMT